MTNYHRLSSAEAAYLRRHYLAGHSVRTLSIGLRMGRNRIKAAIEHMRLPAQAINSSRWKSLPPPESFKGVRSKPTTSPKAATTGRPLGWDWPPLDGDLERWDTPLVGGWR